MKSFIKSEIGMLKKELKTLYNGSPIGCVKFIFGSVFGPLVNTGWIFNYEKAPVVPEKRVKKKLCYDCQHYRFHIANKLTQKMDAQCTLFDEDPKGRNIDSSRYSLCNGNFWVKRQDKERVVQEPLMNKISDTLDDMIYKLNNL